MLSSGLTAQRFHDDALHAGFLAFGVEVFCVGVVAPSSPDGSVAPVEVVHLYLHEVPVVFLLTVEEPVEGAHVAVVGEAEVPDAAGLSLCEEEVEEFVVDEPAVEVVHAATADAVEQVVVDDVQLKAFVRLLIHGLGLVEVPRGRVLVRHFRGDKEFLTGMAGQGLAGEHFRTAAHVHGGGVVIVHAVADGVVHHLVHLLLVVGKAHHAKAQERHALIAAVLHTVGHLVVSLAFRW